MNSVDFWNRWFTAVGWLLISFGIAMAALPQTSVFDFAFNQRVNPVFWPTGSGAVNIEIFQAWIYGVLGATVSGWGVFVVALARHPLRKREKWAWNCLFTGITVWFLIDTAISAYFGVLFNVAFNAAIAVLVYVPLFATYREFK